jgi:hypothetical protein
MVKRGLVQPARDGLFLVERLGVEPSRDLGLDLRTVGPSGICVLAIRAKMVVGSGADVESAGSP